MGVDGEEARFCDHFTYHGRREPGWRRSDEPAGLRRRHRQEELEILTVGERVIEWRAAIAPLATHGHGVVVNRHGRQIEEAARMAGRHHPGEIERQAIADVDRGMHGKSRGDLGRLATAGYDAEMSAQQAAAAGAGDDDQVAHAGPVASPRPARRYAAEGRGADHEWAGPGIGITTSEGDVVVGGKGSEALMQILRQSGAGVVR